MTILALQGLVGLHVLCAAVFFGVNLYLDFILTPAMNEILPGQAARLSDRVGVRVAVLTLGALAGLPITGFLLLWLYGNPGALLDPRFYLNPYGAALGVMMALWATASVSGLLLMFVLRPMFVVRLPLDAAKETVETVRDRGIKAGAFMGVLAKYNAIASILAMLTGGFLRYGGFW